MNREINIFEDETAIPREWHVEDINSDGDGGISTAIFSGPYAEARARRFVDRLQSNSD